MAQIHPDNTSDYSLFCNILGLEEALLLAVEQNNINFAAYIISLGPYPYMIKHAIIAALDRDHKDLAYHLSDLSDMWDHYNGKYNPNLPIDKNTHDHMLSLAKYGHHEQLFSLDDVPDFWTEFLRISCYLTSLMINEDHDIFLEELEKHVSDLRHAPIWFYLDMFREIIRSGTVTLLMTTIEIISESRNMTDLINPSNDLGLNLISAALKSDRVDMMTYLITSIGKESITTISVVKSKEMFDLLRLKLPKIRCSDLHRAILHSHNYRLLEISLQDWKKVPCHSGMVPFMVKIAMDDCQSRGVPVFEQALKGVKVYLVDFFMYDFLRSIGCEIDLDIMESWIDRVKISKRVNLDHLSYLKADLDTIRER